jgi:hypothetical protein
MVCSTVSNGAGPGLGESSRFATLGIVRQGIGVAAESDSGLILSTITTYRTRHLSQPPSQQTRQPST